MSVLKIKDNGEWIEIPSIANVEKQVYIGNSTPENEEVLIWIDTSDSLSDDSEEE